MDNCTLGQNVYIGNKVSIGNNVKIQNNVSVYDSVHLEDDVFCGPVLYLQMFIILDQKSVEKMSIGIR